MSLNKNAVFGPILKKSIPLILIVIFLLVFTFAGCCYPADAGAVTQQTANAVVSSEETARTTIEKNQSPLNNSQLEQFNKEVNSLVERVTPSVAFIIVSVMQQDYFGNETISEGVGSGVIYSDDGYIITNSHVAGGAIELKVILADGSEYKAELVNASTQTDIAVIKIDEDDLQPATFATIEEQHVGDFVMAVGSPFGIEQTVTTGIISGKNRNLTIYSDQYPIVDLIQTDAAINPGNSGGPLINIYGDVIGINTLIFSPSGGSAGVGFAIPSDTAVNITGQIIKYGEPKIPFIGIEIGTNDTEITGVMVAGVIADTPAEKAGLKVGDIIVEFAGKEMKTPFDLLTQIIRSNCGEIIKAKVYRNGGYLDFDLELEQCPVELQNQ